MKYIFLDLEMNPVKREFKEVRKCCSREIIEIGAVMLDEKLNIVSEFREYVKPAYNAEVVRRVRNLTGITTEMLEDAAPFCQVFDRFVRWCGNEEYQIYSWSDNDIYQMMDELLVEYHK